ncbi:MAG: S-adenosylmethionine:tRNA ribosyltransferase-isomerase [Chloroflexota bacterium]|nr:S-adenosylmethionine:tRNA ribosyltransferase-isomerase [Chloroflexota bacterium]
MTQDPDLLLSSYDYVLPPELIAQAPAEPRDSARLLVLDRGTGSVTHRHVRDLPDLLDPGDLVVVNRSRVLPCRLLGHKIPSGGRVELLLLRPLADDAWEALVGGRRVADGQRVRIADDVVAEIGGHTPGGREVRFPSIEDVPALLRAHGHMPLPPYIHGYAGDPGRYQTVYAEVEGSAAAPTAGLHFTPELIERLGTRGIGWATVLLHVGLDTFRPIAHEHVMEHKIHTEWAEIDESTAEAIAETKRRHKRAVAIGTTTVRTLEFAARDGAARPFRGSDDLFIVPGHRYQAVDAMLTNFHLPRSSLLLLVAAFAGRERMLEVYETAVRERYRFFSFGDAMLIL